jgi:hypothetical protein
VILTTLKPEPDDPAQSQRFIDMAEELGARDDEATFEAKMKAIARHKPKSPDGRAPSGTEK